MAAALYICNDVINQAYKWNIDASVNFLMNK